MTDNQYEHCDGSPAGPMVDCWNCRGRGYFECENCDGDSSSIGGCPLCHGEDAYDCDICDGCGLVEAETRNETGCLE